jgi:hypothetical protein
MIEYPLNRDSGEECTEENGIYAFYESSALNIGRDQLTIKNASFQN